MKKTTLALMTMVSMMLATTAVSAAPAVQSAVPTPAPVATTATTTTPTTASAQDKVKVNGVEMTREQARQVIIANIRNHTQMTPEEMVAYIGRLEADANVAQAVQDGTLQPNVAPAQAFNQ
jgi:Rieske Fe-S protein